MVVTLVSLALVALARCILNRSKVERVREQVEHIIHSQLQHENHCQLIQPMLGKRALLTTTGFRETLQCLMGFLGQCEMVKSR